MDEASLGDGSPGSSQVVLGLPWLVPLLWDCSVLPAADGDQSSETTPLSDCSANPVKSFWLLTPGHQLCLFFSAGPSSSFTHGGREGEAEWWLGGAGGLPSTWHPWLWGLCQPVGTLVRAWGSGELSDSHEAGQGLLSLCREKQITHSMVVGPFAPPKGG